FCLPYLSQSDTQKFITDGYNLLNDNGLIYISFVEGAPSKSGFQTSSSGDRCYFYYHTLQHLNTLLIENNFNELHIFKVPYKKSESEIEIHTIVTAKKKTSK